MASVSTTSEIKSLHHNNERNFYCKTREGYSIKTLAELLSYYIKTKCVFTFGFDGIRMCAVGEKNRVLVDFVLRRADFVKYECTEERVVELNIANTYKMLKPVKKNDIVILSINGDDLNHLLIESKSNETSGHQSINRIKITDTKGTSMDDDLNYDKGEPINVLSKDFQRMCKSLGNISKEMEVVSNNPSVIQFYCNGNDIGDANSTFGEEEDMRKVTRTYKLHFPTQVITRLSKIVGLTKNLKIFATDENLPLFFDFNIGNLGHMSLYIKSNEFLVDQPDKT